MTYDELLCADIESLGLSIEPGVDTTAGGEYVVYAYTRSGTLYGDDAPCLEQRNWSLVYVAPLSCDRLDMRMRILQMIFNRFCVWPTEDDVSDVNGQRWLYEFTTIGGLEDGSD